MVFWVNVVVSGEGEAREAVEFVFTLHAENKSELAITVARAIVRVFMGVTVACETLLVEGGFGCNREMRTIRIVDGLRLIVLFALQLAR